MLINATKLIGFPVLSLHVGGPVAKVTSVIVDPNDLRVIAFKVDGPTIGRDDIGTILEADSVREFSNIGMIIDSTDELVNPGDVIRLDEIMDLHFDVVGLKAVTKRGTKLGKVKDFTITTDDFRLAQVIVERPPLKALLDPELVIGRSEITEVTDYKIIFKDEEEKIRKKAAKEDFIPNFVNPFRKPDLDPVKAQHVDED